MLALLLQISTNASTARFVNQEPAVLNYVALVCGQVWFCSQECIKEAWKRKDGKGHKPSCKLYREFGCEIAMIDCQLTVFEETLRKYGVAVVSQGLVLMSDFEDNCMFDSLSDERIRCHRHSDVQRYKTH